MYFPASIGLLRRLHRSGVLAQVISLAWTQDGASRASRPLTGKSGPCRPILKLSLPAALSFPYPSLPCAWLRCYPERGKKLPTYRDCHASFECIQETYRAARIARFPCIGSARARSFAGLRTAGEKRASV